MNEKTTKTKKSPAATSEEAGATAGCRELKQGTAHVPLARNTTKGVGKTPKPPLQAEPFTPYKEHTCPT